jgi:[ribosomal protein S5]-alanine N-acetyltransferase
MAKIELRPLVDGDVTDNYLSWLNDSGISKYLGLRHKSDVFVKEDIIRFLRECSENRRFHWGIFHENCHVGNVSCSLWDNNNKYIDISFIIGDKSTQGKGVATLSVGAAIEYLFNKIAYNRVQAHAISDNISSIRIMEKLGMKREAVLRQRAFMPNEGAFKDEVIYSVLKEEWNKSLSANFKHIQISPMDWE